MNVGFMERLRCSRLLVDLLDRMEPRSHPGGGPTAEAMQCRQMLARRLHVPLPVVRRPSDGGKQSARPRNPGSSQPVTC
ncbi:MAG TPA: hypothetical protein DD418_23605 [Pseudomonas sp.]|nr:hypothetical protein [Pseudomonas sp.]